MQKDNYLSAIKGFAIIAVVFIYTPFVYSNEFLNIVLRQPFIFNMNVPDFLIPLKIFIVVIVALVLLYGIVKLYSKILYEKYLRIIGLK